MPCPGYRNKLDLCFRDESETVARKVQTKQKSLVAANVKKEQRRKRTESPEFVNISFLKPESVSDAFSGWDASEAVRLACTTSMSLPLEDIAMNHFLTTHVRGSRFEYLPQICSDVNYDSPVIACVNASAVAALARELRDPAMMAMAHDHYSRALTMTNKALAIPQEAALDGTLVSVLLLSLFETIAQDNRDAPSNWTAHVQGAGALLSLRGTEQFQTPLGRELFLQVITNVRTSSAQRQVRVPPEIMRLQEEATPFLDPRNQSFQFSIIIDQFATLRAEMAETESRDSVAIIDTALDIERQICEMLAAVPPVFQYKVVPADLKSRAYGATVHEYPNHRIAQLWNSTRMMRILINQLIHHQISVEKGRCFDLSPDLSPEPMADDWLKFQDTTMDDMDMDYCSSIPSIDGSLPLSSIPEEWVKLQEQTARNVADIAMEICATVPQFAASSPPPTVFSVAPLLWPLTTAAESDLSPPSVRTYIIDRLYYLGKEAKFPQATWAAQMLDQSEHLEDWCVYPWVK
jgi:hypothetical protein